MAKSVLILLVSLLVLGNKGYCQHLPPYSLQPALEAIHRRDAIALNTAPSLAGGRFPPQPQIDYNDEGKWIPIINSFLLVSMFEVGGAGHLKLEGKRKRRIIL